MIRLLSGALALAAVLGATCAADTVVPPSTMYAQVSTWIGSGARGNFNGSGLQASFIMPTGLVFDAGGTLLAADSGAQNIRAIDPSGTTRTFAGPDAPLTDTMPGGYVGPAAAARFDGPMGMAIGPDGALYLADSRNRVVRRIANGTVSTFIGQKGDLPVIDGPAAVATFLQPMGVAFDDRGNLYVADNGIGVRIVDATTRTVSTLAGTSTTHATGVAFSSANGLRSLFVADNAGLSVYDLARGTSTRLETVVDLAKLPQRVEGEANAGFPFAVGALTPSEAVYTDLREDSLFYSQSTFVRQIAGAEVPDPSAYAGGWRDGLGPEVRLNVPMGIAVAKDGRIAVADSGNRVIRLVSGIDRRYYVGYDLRNFDTYRPGPHDYGIAIVGTSMNWNDTVWDDSIAGVAQKTLDASSTWKVAGLRPPAIVPFTLLGGYDDDKIKFIEDTVSDLPVHCVVYLADLFSLQRFGDPAYSVVIESGPHAGELNRGLIAAFASKFRHLRKVLASKHIDFIIVFTPDFFDVSPAESPITQLLQRYPYNDRIQIQHQAAQLLGELLRADGMFYSASPLFERAQTTPHPLPLFGTTDFHPNINGRALIGTAVARALEENAETLAKSGNSK